MYILDNGTNKDIGHYIEDKVNSLIWAAYEIIHIRYQGMQY